MWKSKPLPERWNTPSCGIRSGSFCVLIFVNTSKETKSRSAGSRRDKGRKHSRITATSVTGSAEADAHAVL